MSDLVFRLKKRAEIRRSISTRKSVLEGKPDRIANILDEAAEEIVRLHTAFEYLVSMLPEDCTAGFVAHARAIASGDQAEIERTK